MELQRINNYLNPEGLLEGYQKDLHYFNNFVANRGINEKSIIEYFEAMKQRKNKVATMQRHKCSIKAGIIKSIGQGIRIIELAQIDVFFKSIKCGTRNYDITGSKVLSKDELKEIIKVSGLKTSLIIRALFETAARISELVNIRIADCTETKDGVVVKMLRKGKKEGAVFLSTELFEEIKRVYKSSEQEYLFYSKRSGHISRFTCHTLIKRAGAKIGRPDIHCHSYRHTWATLSLPTLGLPKVAGYLSHKDTSTTARFYLHGKAEQAEIQAVNKLHFV